MTKNNHIYIRFTKPESYADVSDALLFDDIVNALNSSADFSEFEPMLVTADEVKDR